MVEQDKGFTPKTFNHTQWSFTNIHSQNHLSVISLIYLLKSLTCVVLKMIFVLLKESLNPSIERAPAASRGLELQSMCKCINQGRGWKSQYLCCDCERNTLNFLCIRCKLVVRKCWVLLSGSRAILWHNRSRC